MSLFSAAFGGITNLYVDPVDASAMIDVAVATLDGASEGSQPLSADEAVEKAIEAMLKSVDSESAYLNSDSYADLRGDREHGGVGLELTRRNGVVTVVAPLPESPAERVGIRTGDRLTEIDGSSTEKVELHEIVTRLRGPVGSPVTLKLERPGTSETLARTIPREIVRFDPVAVSRHSEHYAYVRIAQFGERTAQTLMKQLDVVRAQGPIDGIVLDLRGNPGGLLSAAVRVADTFIAEGLIVETRGRTSTNNQAFNAHTDGSEWEKIPVVIVVDGGTAAGSEIVAAALRFHRGSSILGTRTFGRGTIQTIVPLDGRAALRLTTSRAITPLGLLAKPLVPDVLVETPESKRPTIDDAAINLALRELSSAAEALDNENQR